MASKTLLLTSWYLPIQIISWQDAVKMKYEGTIDVVAEYNEDVCSPSITWKMPAVVRLRREVRTTKAGVKFSRVNVYTRDHYTCQYCGKKFTAKELTYDHVVPRKSGGRTNWNNIVACCSRCNYKKDCRTCDETGMFPINPPVKPKRLPLGTPLIDRDNAPAEWLPYLPVPT
jgi:5-methylcytosine-specific restriction endonuclease McrA